MPIPAILDVPILDVRGVSFGFGGVAALQDVDLTVSEGECVGLIGPNGAGKSTLINCITRIYPVHRGSISIDGADTARRQPSDLVSLGVKRTFQNIETFREMTVREVLEVGAHHLGSTSMIASILGARSVAAERDRITAEVERTATVLGVDGLMDVRVSALPYGLQKKVDLARALVGGARLLLLDEPAAGLDTDEWHELADLLRATVAEISATVRPVGILLIEHQLGFVRRLADRLYALDAGTVIASGQPAEVLADRRVVESYLGTVATVEALMLEVDDLRVAYGPVQAVRGISLRVGAGEVVGMIGANGAGKTTTLNAILGLVPAAGKIRLDGRELTGLRTPARIRAGLALVPQGRQLFGGLSVADNLRAGSWLASRKDRIEPLELLRDFPALHTKLRQQAATLSGGEQQMVALARGLASGPSCVLLDEPSMGLSPIMIDRVAEAIGDLVRDRGLTVLLVDQGVGMVARLATRGYVLVHGEIADELDAEALRGRAVERAYFG